MISSIQVILAQEHKEFHSTTHFHSVGLILWLSLLLQFQQVLEAIITKLKMQEVFSKAQDLIISSRILSSNIIFQQSFLKVHHSLLLLLHIQEILVNSSNLMILTCLISLPQLMKIIKSKGPKPTLLLWSHPQVRLRTRHSFNQGIKFPIRYQRKIIKVVSCLRCKRTRWRGIFNFLNTKNLHLRISNWKRSLP